MAAQHTARERADVARADGFDQPQQDAANNRPGQVANAAEHRCREGLQTRQKTHGVLHGAVIGGVHDAGNGGKHRADDEGGRNHHVGLDAHQAGDTRVLGRSAHRTAELGVIHQVHQRSQRHRRHSQNQNLRGGDDGAANLERLGRQQCRVRLVVGLPDDHGQRLQQDRHAKRGDERRQSGAVAERPVSHLFNHEIECGSHHTGNDGGQKQHQPARRPGHGFLHQADAAPAGQRPDHEHLTVRKIDELDDAVHHGVTQGNQGIHAAKNQTVDDLLQQDVHKNFLRWGQARTAADRPGGLGRGAARA